MVGGAEGPGLHQGAAGGGEPHDGVDLGGLQGLGQGHVGQDAGQTAGQHGLARAGRAGHEHVVAPGGGDLQGPLHLLLALYLGKVRAGVDGGPGLPGRGGGDGLLPGEVPGQLGHIPHGIDRRPLGQRGLGGVLLGHEQGSDAGLFGGQGHGQHPGTGAQLAGQGQLPQKGAAGLGQPDLSPGGQNAHQNGQVVQGAHLFQMGGSQIHRDPADGEGEAAVFDGRAHPLPGLGHGGIGQTDDGKGGQAAGQIALGGDGIARHSVQTQRGDRADHSVFLPSCGTAPTGSF